MRRAVLYTSILAVGLLIVGLLVVLGRPINPDFEKKFHCMDHDQFCIHELETVKTFNGAAVNEDLIVVEKKFLRLTLYRGGKVLRQYTVAVGKPSTPTPVGEYKIINKGGKWGGGFGERWMGLNVPWGIYGIHGTNQPGSIGRMSSHGCIRMRNSSVMELYNLVQVGTPVHIIGKLENVVLNKYYKRGATGEDVLKIQFALRKMGFDIGAADGRFGSGMEQAVVRLQQYYGLQATGKITPNELLIMGLE